MEKLIKKIPICFLIAVIIFQAICSNMPYVSGFFSSAVEAGNIIFTGSVNIAIENIGSEAGVLPLNTSQVFSFTLTNTAASDADYVLDIQIAWDDDLDEVGKIFVYPSWVSDGIILENLTNGDYSDAVFIASSDTKEIPCSSGISPGIWETADYGFLNSRNAESQSGGNDDSRKDYSFKVFFFEDGTVSPNTQNYDGKFLEIGVLARYDVKNRKTGWASSTRHFFRYQTSAKLPVITEINRPKTFFVTQASNLDLKSYAQAFDTDKSDITDKIRVSSSPQFNSAKSGTYQITYNVTNSLDISAVPLIINIVIWDFVKIESGNYHALALTSHGKVYSWGYNYYGQLGDGTNMAKYTPILVEGLNDIIDIAAGDNCSFALSADGQIYSWGSNENGRLGDNTTETKRRPGKVSQPDGVRFTQIAADTDTAAAVTDQGNVYTWGYGGEGALGDGLTSDRYAPGLLDLSDIAKVSINSYNGAAITSQGKLYTWGYGSNGMLANGSSASIISKPVLVTYFDTRNIKIKDISVGQINMAAVSESGELFTWGYGGEGQLGNGGTASRSIPQLIPLPSKAVKAVAGDNHSGVMTEDGTVLFFGDNYYGQQGNGDTEVHLVPTPLEGVFGATYICLGTYTSFVLSDSQTVRSMGYGGSGLLGNGKNEHSAIPVVWSFVPPQPS